MPRLLTHFLVFHWAVVFSLLAGLTVFGGDLASVTGVHTFGIETADARLAMMSLPGARALVACAFALCAVFFWWALATALLSGPGEGQPPGDEVLRLAFGAAAGLVTLLLVVGTMAGVDGVFPVMATHFAALVASFVAIRTEQQNAQPQQNPQQGARDEELRLAARVKAIDASATAGLPRFTPRRDASWARWDTDR